jgi:hypothetical protein
MEYDNVDSVKAAAAINSNVRDVAQWLRMHLADGMLDGKRVLTARNVRQLQQSVNPLPVSAGRSRVLGTHFRSYGLGWFLEDYEDHKLVSHGGGLTGMISETLMVPEQGLGVVVLSNMAMNNLPTALTRWIVDRYLGIEPRDWSGLYLGFAAAAARRQQAAEQQLVAARLPDAPPSLPLRAYTGTYHNPLPGKATVELEGERLYFFYNRRHRGYLTPWQHHGHGRQGLPALRTRRAEQGQAAPHHLVPPDHLRCGGEVVV